MYANYKKRSKLYKVETIDNIVSSYLVWNQVLPDFESDGLRQP